VAIEHLVVADHSTVVASCSTRPSGCGPQCTAPCGAPHFSPISRESHLRVIAGILSLRQDLDEATIGVLSAPRGDALGDDRRSRGDMDRFSPGIGLLQVIGNGHGVERADRVVAREDAAWILPGNGGAGRGQVRSLLDKRVGTVVTVGLTAGALRSAKSLWISSRIAFS
jgi:hypothetical protein